MSKNFVRGGQIHLHNLRMIKQISTVSLVVSLLVGAGVFYMKVMASIPFYALQQYIVSYKAEYILPWKSPYQRHHYMVAWPQASGEVKVRAVDLMQSQYTYDLRNWVKGELKDNIGASANGFFGSLFCILLFWFFKGQKSLRSRRLRGQSMVSARWLTFLIRLKGKASDLMVEFLPLIKNAETKHILVVGTTGSGKTNLFNELLPQIERRQQKALVIDTTGDMISKYYKPERGDIIINPFDVRSSNWDIINECYYEYQFDNLAKAIVPKNSDYSDPIWRNGSATLFSVGLQKAKEEGILPLDLHSTLVKSPLIDFCSFFKNTDAAAFADSQNEKTTLSFRATLSSSVQFLKYLDPIRPSFLLADWVNDDDSNAWVFLTANEDMIETLNPLIAAIFNSVAGLLMTQTEDNERRLWFILDELPVLQKLNMLQPLLSKGRKYGGCVFGGLQSMSQFIERYNTHGSKTILNLFNTKFFFRAEETEACEQISKWLGEEEIEETKESLSYGAHQMRDGVSLNHQKSTRRLVLPTEISKLPDLTCYIKYPGSFSISKLKMKYNKRPFLQSAFELSQKKEN